MRTSALFLVVVVALVAFCSLAFAQEQDPRLQLESIRLFEQYIGQFNKVYQGTEEHQQRLRVFQQNMNVATYLNQQHNTNVFSVNTPFADMTQEEFRNKVLMDPATIKTHLTQLKKSGREYASDSNSKTAGRFPIAGVASHDWNNMGIVTPVKDQGECGSCWAHAATECLETAYARKYGVGSLPILSPQQLVDCDQYDSGCEGGWVTNAWYYLQTAGGQAPLSSYQYTGQDGTCSFSGSINPAAIPTNIVNFGQYMDTTQAAGIANENLIYDYVEQTSVVTIAVDATNWQYYSSTSGIFPASACSTDINHAVMVTGYQNINGTDVWNVRNSWGTWWGNQGYLYLPMWQNACTVGSYANSCDAV